jgi:hypothetical protein
MAVKPIEQIEAACVKFADRAASRADDGLRPNQRLRQA